MVFALQVVGRRLVLRERAGRRITSHRRNEGIFFPVRLHDTGRLLGACAPRGHEKKGRSQPRLDSFWEFDGGEGGRELLRQIQAFPDLVGQRLQPDSSDCPDMELLRHLSTEGEEARGKNKIIVQMGWRSELGATRRGNRVDVCSTRGQGSSQGVRGGGWTDVVDHHL